MSARIGEHEDRTRLVIELSDPVNLRAFTLANPDRVVMDMPEVAWRLGAPPRPTGFGSVKSYRYGLFRAGNSRMVIDLNRPVTVSRRAGAAAVRRLRLPGGDRPVSHHAGQIRRQCRLARRPQEARKRCRKAGGADRGRSQRRCAAGKKVIVIDPGHGGIDSGTIGVNGLMEKDLVLAEGLKLAQVLQARGYTVHHDPRQRHLHSPARAGRASPRQAQADLFISLHADSNPDPDVNGLSIYTLQ